MTLIFSHTYKLRKHFFLYLCSFLKLSYMQMTLIMNPLFEAAFESVRIPQSPGLKPSLKLKISPFLLHDFKYNIFVN